MKEARIGTNSRNFLGPETKCVVNQIVFGCGSFSGWILIRPSWFGLTRLNKKINPLFKYAWEFACFFFILKDKIGIWDMSDMSDMMWYEYRPFYYNCIISWINFLLMWVFSRVSVYKFRIQMGLRDDFKYNLPIKFEYKPIRIGIYSVMFLATAYVRLVAPEPV